MLTRIKRFFTRKFPETGQIPPEFLDGIRRDMQDLIANPTREGLEAYRKQAESQLGTNPGLDVCFGLIGYAIESFGHLSLNPELHQSFWANIFARCVLLSVKTFEDFASEIKILGDSLSGGK